MAINAHLIELTPPVGTEIPRQATTLLAFIRQYMTVAGFDGFTGINFGSTEPSPDNRDRPWFKTDVPGNPLGWFSWNGTSWVAIPDPFAIPVGAVRPASPYAGLKFFDTTINCELTYERGKWRTSSGVPGDVKHVTATDITTALNQNPGWLEYTAAAGRVIGSAGTGAGLTARAQGVTVGAESVTLTVPQIPSHSHTSKFYGQGAGGGANRQFLWTADPYADSGLLRSQDAENTGGGAAHENMQPTIFLFCLYKE